MNSPKKFETLLFDLDGTLIDVEMQLFIPAYIRGLAARFKDFSPPDRFGAMVRESIFALIETPDGDLTNEQQFLAGLEKKLDIPPRLFQSRFRLFVQDGLASLASMVRPVPLARDILSLVTARGFRIILATNPVFPLEVIRARLAWGNLQDFSFDWITSYENSRFCKPHPAYFREVLARFGVEPGRCLMVGNDTVHDLSAGQAGMGTFLVEDLLVERPGADFPPDFRGSLATLFDFFSSLPGPTRN